MNSEGTETVSRLDALFTTILVGIIICTFLFFYGRIVLNYFGLFDAHNEILGVASIAASTVAMALTLTYLVTKGGRGSGATEEASVEDIAWISRIVLLGVWMYLWTYLFPVSSEFLRNLGVYNAYTSVALIGISLGLLGGSVLVTISIFKHLKLKLRGYTNE